MYHCVGSKISLPAFDRPPKRNIASGDVTVTTSASARPSISPVKRKASRAMGSPCSAAAEIIEASKSPKAMSRSLLGADILAISSNAVRLMPVAET